MSPSDLIQFVTQGGALAWILWEVRHLRDAVRLLRQELDEDVNDLRRRVQRLEDRLPPPTYIRPMEAHP